MIDYTKIKQDVADALEGAIPGVVEISIDKILPQEFEDLPSISIYTISTNAASITHTDPPAFNTTVSIILDIIVSENNTFMQTLDGIVERIKTRLFQETMDDWFHDNDFTEILEYIYEISPSTQGSRETVTGEFVISVTICEAF